MLLRIAVLLGAVVVLSRAAEEEKKDNYGTVVGIDLGTTYSW